MTHKLSTQHKTEIKPTHIPANNDEYNPYHYYYYYFQS